jgi:hypothetical protein
MEEQARALGGLGDGHYIKGQFHTSGKLFERCVQVSASHGFRRIEAANLPMLGMMMWMDLNFDRALELVQRAVALSEQIGLRRAAMIACHGIGFLGFDTCDMKVARRGIENGLAIAEALGARRFIAEGLIIRAQYEFLTGDAGAAAALAEGNEIARETPSFILPYGLAVAALIAPDEAARRAALSEGEAVLAAGAISHNYVFFNRNAMEACIRARDWAGARRYASALEQRMAGEPFAMSDFLVARARAIADAGEGRRDKARISLLIDQACAARWPFVIPELEAALAF